jgi:5-formyltetrahydrofolate cyclo-ligase
MKKCLRIKAKKKRALISFTIENKNTFLKNVNSCLDNIFSIDYTLKVVGLYHPILNEISPFGFIKYLNIKNVITALPVVDIYTNSMFFKKWHPREILQKGCLGNYEPSLKNKTVFPQIIVVPMLMFDRKLNRLGYGGGYYDKSIFSLKQYFNKEEKSFFAIGLAYSEQETKSIPYESHDQKLDFIITEKEIISKSDLD